MSLRARGRGWGVLTVMCYFRVVDTQTKRLRKCRSPNVRSGPLCINVCWVHSWDPAAKIQAAWRQFKTRKTIGVFKTLPGDLWGEVLRHVERRNKVPDLIRSHRKVYDTRYTWARDNWALLQRATVENIMDMDTVRQYKVLMDKCTKAACNARVRLQWCDNLLNTEVKCA